MVLLRVAQGDERAMEQCITKFGPLVWSIAKRHVQDHSSLEDNPEMSVLSPRSLRSPVTLRPMDRPLWSKLEASETVASDLEEEPRCPGSLALLVRASTAILLLLLMLLQLLLLPMLLI